MAYEREFWLTATALELVGVEAAAFDDVAHANLLVARLAELLAPTEVALLAADESGNPAITAANTHRARDLLALESRFHAGPCTTCYQSGKPSHGAPIVPADDVAGPFGTAVGRLGYRTCSTLPMCRRDEIVGAVCILDAGGDTADEQQVERARLLVDAATIGLLQQRALRRSTLTSQQLQAALDSRVVIEQAKGVLAAQLGATTQVGFDVLRGYARRNNEQLVQVADKVVRGVLSDRDLKTDPRHRD